MSEKLAEARVAQGALEVVVRLFRDGDGALGRVSVNGEEFEGPVSVSVASVDKASLWDLVSSSVIRHADSVRLPLLDDPTNRILERVVREVCESYEMDADISSDVTETFERGCLFVTSRTVISRDPFRVA